MEGANRSLGRFGFTLVELVILFLIMTVLLVLAVPRFINMGSDARMAKVEAVTSAVRAAAQVVRAASLIRRNDASTGSVAMDSITINTNFGYPQAVGPNGIVDAAGLDSSLISNNDRISYTGGGTAGGSALTIAIAGATNVSSCQVSYVSPSTVNAAPTIHSDLSGC